MHESNREPHPLDDDDDGVDERPIAWGTPNAYLPLLKPSLRVLAASFVIVFIGGLAATVATPNSAIETVGSAVNRFGMIVMLGAFFAVLVAYRIPQMGETNVTVSQLNWFRSSMTKLVAINILCLGMIVVILFVAYTINGAIATGILTCIFPAYAGLMVTMVIWHTGYLRAYAVGVLTAVPLVCISGAFAMGAWRFRTPSVGFMWVIFFFLATAPLTGMLCATYVCVLESWRRARNGNSDCGGSEK